MISRKQITRAKVRYSEPCVIMETSGYSRSRAQEETAATAAGAVAIGGGGGGGVVLCAGAAFSGLVSVFSFDGVAAGVGVWPSVVPGTACGVDSVFDGEGCEAGAAGLLGEAVSAGGVVLGVS